MFGSTPRAGDSGRRFHQIEPSSSRSSNSSRIGKRDQRQLVDRRLPSCFSGGRRMVKCTRSTDGVGISGCCGQVRSALVRLSRRPAARAAGRATPFDREGRRPALLARVSSRGPASISNSSHGRAAMVDRQRPSRGSTSPTGMSNTRRLLCRRGVTVQLGQAGPAPGPLRQVVDPDRDHHLPARPARRRGPLTTTIRRSASSSQTR